MVVSILGIISTVLIFPLLNFKDRQNLDKDASAVEVFLREALIYTLASQADSQYGVKVTSSELFLFRGDVWSEEEVVKSYVLAESNEISSVDLQSGGDEVVFQRLTGQTDDHGQIVVSAKEDPTRSRIIELSAWGVIEI